MFNKSPKWISEIPVEREREALTRLAHASRHGLEDPREMNFELLDIKPGEIINAIVDLIEKAGWSCETGPDGDKDDRIALRAIKKDYVLTRHTYLRDFVFFNRIAKMYGCTYAGWFASNN